MNITIVNSGEFKENFLVVSKIDDHLSYGIMGAREIFDMMGMSDLYSIDIKVYRLGGIKDEPQLCKFRNTWHDPRDPLKMTIEYRGEILATGYAPDH